jgi:hypothetical protein
MSAHARWLLGVALFLALAGEQALSVEVTAMKTPGGGVQPHVAVDVRGVAHLIYLKGDPAAADLEYVRETQPGSLAWTPPRRVNSEPGTAVALGSIRGGAIALGRDGWVHVVWNGAMPKQKQAGAQPDSSLFYTRSRGGAPFEAQRNLITTAKGLDGGAAVAADNEGRVFAAWHGNPERSGEAHRAVYLARSTDDGRAFAAEQRVISTESGACGCCGMSALVDGGGTLRLLYRAARESVNRDITLLSSRDHGGTFALTPVQPWTANACPLSSMSVAPTATSAVIAWEKAGQVYFSDAAEPTKAVAPDGRGGSRKHPALAINKSGERLLAWTDGTGWARGGTFAWQIFDAQNRPTSQRGKGGPVPVWGTVAVFARPDGSFALLY